MSKKEGIAVGDMVGWNSSGGHAMGRVERIKRDGTINVPDSKFTIQGSEDDPAVLIRIYQNGEKTDTLVGHKMSTLRKGFTKHFEVKKANPNHDQLGRFASGPGGSAGAAGGLDAHTQKMVERGFKALQRNDYKAMMADYDKMEAKWRKKLDKPFDPAGPEEYGDPQDLASTDFFRKYGAYPTEVQMVAEALPVNKYNNSHDNYGRFASAGHGDDATGIAPNGDDNMAAMDMMDIKHPSRTKRKLTAEEQTLLNRITSAATNYVARPGENRGVYNLPFSAPTRSKGGITGYVPNSGVTGQPGAASS